MACTHCNHTHEHVHNERKERIITIIRIVISSILAGLSYINFNVNIGKDLLGNPFPIVNFILALVGYLIIGYDTVINTIKGFKEKEFFDENFLMLIATIGAFVIGEYAEACLVLILYHIGEMCEDYATDKANHSIVSLISNMPLYAHKKVGDKIQEENPEDIKVGDVLVINPGEKVALDGIIISSHASLDQSSLTGESLPVEVTNGDKIYSGSINLDKSFELQVTKVYSSSTLSRILSLVTEEENNKSKQEKFISRFSKIYTPIVCLIAVFIFLLLWGLKGFAANSFSSPLYNALNILIISCPCSLVISIPLSFFIGIGKASKFGILIKGGLALENIGKAEIFCFDKTGTITSGSFVIENLANIKDESLILAASLEQNISHPIAKAYISEANNKNLNLFPVSNFENIQGVGIKGTINNKTYYLGSMKLTKILGYDIKETKSPYLVNYLLDEDGILLDTIILKDKIKETSASSLAQIKTLGVKKTIMISGDNDNICSAVCKEVNIDTYYSSLLPEEKLEKLKEIKVDNSNKIIAYVGDGINDSPSLIASDVGIAMGGLGSDAARESADIVIMNDNLSSIPLARRLSKKVMMIILENLIFILAFKLTIMILAGFNISNMILSIAADVGVMIVAILNSLRITLFKNKTVKP